MNLRKNRIIFLSYVWLLQALAFVAASQSVCPPTDETKLKAVDAYIQEVLGDPNKFTALANQIFKDNTNATELAGIVKRIKAKASPDKPLKGITSSEDWTRLRVIVCPYLVKDPPTNNAKEPTILFRGIAYKNNSTIAVDYDNENFTYDFELKDYPPASSNIGWEIFSEGYNDQNSPTQIDVSQIAISGYPAGASGNKLKLIAEKAYSYKVVGKYGADKISVNFIRNKKVFEIKQLLAVDMDNEARKAKDGETLYLVRKNNELARSVEFRISTDAPSKSFWPNEPIWHNYKQADRDKQLANEALYGQRDEEYYSKSDAGFTDKTRFKIRHRFDDWSKTTTTSVSAFGNERKVNIRTLTEDRARVKVTLPGSLDAALTNLSNGFDRIGGWLSTLTGKTVEAKIKHDFLLDVFNRESDTRHYHKYRQYSIGLDAAISAELDIPGFKYKWPNVFEMGAYVKPGIKLRVDGGNTERNQSETDSWENYSLNLSGKVVGSVEAGVLAKLLVDPKTIEVDVKAYAKSGVAGAVNYGRVPSETLPNEVNLAVSIDPLILGISAKLKLHTSLLDIQLLDYSGELWITDRINFETEKTRF
jgi:hypothetical protein